MRPVVVSVGPLAASNATNIALSQVPSNGLPMQLNGALNTTGKLPIVLDAPRRVLLTFGNEISARTLVLTGTNWSGNPISETLAVPSGAGGTVASALDYATLASAVPGGGNWSVVATLGTNSVGGSQWVNFDEWVLSQVAIQCTAAGTVNYTIQQTLDGPNSLTNPVAVGSMTWINSSDMNVVNAVGSVQSNYAYAPRWARVVLNSGTGSVTATFVQFGSPGRPSVL